MTTPPAFATGLPFGIQPLPLYLAEESRRADHRPADHRCLDPLQLGLLRRPQADRQRRHPGRGFQERQDDRHLHGVHPPSASVAGRRELQDIRGLPGRSGRASHGALQLFPAAGPDQRRLQIRHQRPQGHPRRAHAAAHALRPVQPADALPPGGDPGRQAGRDRQHDQGRGRADRRLRRRRLHPAGLPAQPGLDRACLHHGAELLAGRRSRC